MTLPPRAVYCHQVPADYLTLNAARFPSLEAATTAPEPWTRQRFIDDSRLEPLDTEVRILPLPRRVDPAILRQAVAKMRALSAEGFLSALRGGRKTDLPRPIAARARARILDGSPALTELVRRVESALEGSHLFVRALKFDQARASTTSPMADLGARNLHFDAELSSWQDYSEPVYQFYLNVASEPRQFSLVPAHRRQMFQQLVAHRRVSGAEVERLPLEEILRRFDEYFEAPSEIVVVEPWHMTAFDGRAFAHDAGKADMAELLAGRFSPSAEEDFVMALDTRTTGYHVGHYDPDRPFLDDLAEPD